MGAGEDSTPAKTSKPNASAQETPTTPSYPDWGPMQAYYGPGAPPPFFATTAVASPNPHTYMWGGQPAMMSPYGTPVPYPALYPPGGVYAHPNMAMAPGLAHTSMELEGKAVNGKDRAPNKKAKGAQGNTGMIGGKGGESGNTASGSGNDGATQSAESGSEGSSDASDDNQEFAGSESKKGSFDLMLADGANAHNNIGGHQAAMPGAIVSVPATNLNIGMDLWSASGAGAGAAKMRSNAPGSAAPGTMVGREGMMADHYIQDERELKRQKRKQSNRESARRSRLRKQAECEELQARVEALTNENSTLREELQRLSEDCDKLTSENNTIKEDLTRACGPDAISKLENSTNQLIQSYADEGNR